jgi:nucleoside-diphosphate-sugar epimerase
MSALITGGFGCIGCWIVRNLLEQGERVVVFDLKEDHRRLRLILDEPQLGKVGFIAGDVTDLDQLRRTIVDERVRRVIHLAGLQVPTCRADPLLGARVNVLGTLAVFEAVRTAEPPLPRLVYASSAAVFGPAERYAEFRGTPLPNDARLLPSTHYGAFKQCNELNAAIYFQDFGVFSVGLRPWAVYGVGRDFGMTSEPTKAIKSVALGRPFHITFGGSLDLQLADDVARAFILAATRPYEGAKSYSLRGTVVDIAAFHRLLCDVAPEAERLVSFGTKPLAIAPNLDDREFQRDIGPLPVTPLAEGIRKTLEHFRRLANDGKLDTADLDAPASPAATPPSDGDRHRGRDQ